MAERRGRQQFEADVAGQHIGEVQAQLGIAVQRGAGAGNVGVQCANPDIAAAFVRVYGDGACTQDDIARLVCIGGRRGDGQGQ